MSSVKNALYLSNLLCDGNETYHRPNHFINRLPEPLIIDYTEKPIFVKVDQLRLITNNDYDDDESYTVSINIASEHVCGNGYGQTVALIGKGTITNDGPLILAKPGVYGEIEVWISTLAMKKLPFDNKILSMSLMISILQ